MPQVGQDGETLLIVGIISDCDHPGPTFAEDHQVMYDVLQARDYRTFIPTHIGALLGYDQNLELHYATSGRPLVYMTDRSGRRAFGLWVTDELDALMQLPKVRHLFSILGIQAQSEIHHVSV